MHAVFKLKRDLKECLPPWSNWIKALVFETSRCRFESCWRYMVISEELIKVTRKWLGKNGRNFFAKVMLKDGGLISTHFNEGMQVRNFLRETGFCDEWSPVDLDDNWMNIVKKAITEDYQEVDTTVDTGSKGTTHDSIEIITYRYSLDGIKTT